MHLNNRRDDLAPESSIGGDRREIEFLCDPELLGHIPAPARTQRFIPDWFRRLDRKLNNSRSPAGPKLTIRACLPVADVFGLGFIIPLPFDLHIHVPDDRVSIRTKWASELPFTPIVPHDPGQIGAPEAPFESAMPLKFINPWRVRLPEGYSVLFTPPLSRPELPFTCFSGLVDCDRFNTTVNIPFVWTGPIGEHHLPAGTPIAQCIPIDRKTLIKGHEARASTEDELVEQAAADHRKFNEEGAYARDWRVRK